MLFSIQQIYYVSLILDNSQHRHFLTTSIQSVNSFMDLNGMLRLVFSVYSLCDSFVMQSRDMENRRSHEWAQLTYILDMI